MRAGSLILVAGLAGGLAGCLEDTLKEDSGGERADAARADAVVDAAGSDAQLPAQTCSAAIGLVDTTDPSSVVGDGTAQSCDETALAAAVASGGVITFSCGSAPVVIDVRTTIDLRTDVDTVIDGAGLVTLDGGGTTRLFYFYSPDFRATLTKVVLQRLTLQNAQAPASDFTPQPPSGDCAWGYKEGSGAAIYLRDGQLHVIDSSFVNNRAASPGPDVGGGAIYAVGSLGVVVVGSRFVGNQGSNSGAVGLLQSTGTFVNTLFEGNQATGEGQNYVEPGCPTFNHDEQGGAGGNGGALAVDGVEETELSFCGCSFLGNHANELGGAVFRTPNGARRETSFERCTLDSNSAGEGGGALYISNSDFKLEASTLSNNSAVGAGGGVRTGLDSALDFVNVTFYDNATEEGLGGALFHGGGGTIRNCTFAKNKAEHGPAYFSAAIAGGSGAAIYNSIFLDNSTLDPWNPMACWFSEASGADNLQWPRKRSDDVQDDTACVTGVVWADAELGTLADNGGPTATMLPASGSPAIGMGNDCPPSDQRGVTRSSSGCTAGAVEP